MAYVYLILTAPYLLLWVLFLILRRDLRKKLLFSSIFASLLGISEILFIPEYWAPQFQTIPILKDLFLETILFTFFLGGVVAIFYQILFNEKKFNLRINPLFTLIAPLLFLSYFFNPFGLNIMVYVYLSMYIGSLIVMLFAGKIFSTKLFYSALINTFFYALVYFTLWYMFPELPSGYDFSKLSGLLIGGIPLEEFLWISSFSLYLTPLYDIWRNYFRRKDSKL